MRARILSRNLIWTTCSMFGCLGIAQAQITVTRARIGCLDNPSRNQGNLTKVVAKACNGQPSCSFQAPTPEQYTAEGVKAFTRPLCTQAMEIQYQCAAGPLQTVTVPGDAWKQLPAQLVCRPRVKPMPQGPKSLGGLVRPPIPPPDKRMPPGPTSSGGLVGLHPPDKRGPQGASLRGYVDLHTHPLANVAFGGKLLYGGVDVGALLPADPDCQQNVRAGSMEQALGHDISTHGGHDFFHNTCGDEIRKAIIQQLQSANNAADVPGDAFGAPDFRHWPVWNDITHQKMWVDWIRRAYSSGLRVMVALAVNNKTLGDATAGPGDYPTDDLSSADLQIAETKAFVGRHPDFMEMAYSSADLERIVRADKLAVVLGVEVDNIGNQNMFHPLPNALISGEIARLYAEGVRYIFPIHVIDNSFGGTAVYEGSFNTSNYREAGHFWDLACSNPSSNPADQITYRYVPDGFDIAVAAVKATKLNIDPFRNPPPPPNCAPGTGHVNMRGLTPEGEFAIKEMMRHGMMIDIDHMSENSRTRAFQLAENVPGKYPLNSGHCGVRGIFSAKTERSLTAAEYRRIAGTHGMAGVGSDGVDAYTWAQAYNAVVSAMGSGAVAGFGTDTDGLAKGMKPRVPLSSVRYDASFPKSRLGSKEWDYNFDGVAHYGMLADFLRDVATAPGGAALINNNLMNGADYFLQMWRKCESLKGSVN